MAVVTEAFDIPLDIMTKLATGEYRRIGGVVRVAMGPNKGQIVKHLKPVKLEQAAQAQNVGAKVLQFAKNNKKGLIIGTVVAGTITAGGVVYHKIKNREPEVVKKYHAALRDYINDIRSGELSMKSINRLMDALDELKQNKNYEKIKIELTTEASFVFIDEFDAFYHFELSESVQRHLKQISGVQIFTTTHNIDLMSNDLLRPDSYFLLENNRIQDISELTEKELRQAHNLQKMYKAGAFNGR